MLPNAKAGIVLRYVNASSQHVLHLELTHYFVSITSLKLEDKSAPSTVVMVSRVYAYIQTHQLIIIKI